MKILIVHNYYQQAGGEDEVFNTEASLLDKVTKVLRYTIHNNAVANINLITLAGVTVWNREAIYRALRQLLCQESHR